MSNEKRKVSRRQFACVVAGATAAATPFAGRQTQSAPGRPAPQTTNALTQNTSTPQRRDVAPEQPPFNPPITFTRKDMEPAVHSFPMTDVRLLDGPFKRAQDADLAYLKRLSADRLLHNFRVNAGLPSSAEPLGGWEKPDCELRGHFVGHYLSACAMMYSTTGDVEVKKKGDYIVAELAKCQAKLGGGGYLSAFPLEFFDRLDRREKVWAPFYTIHKIMAGKLDMHQHCGNQQALDVLKGMADWCDRWTASKSEEHMQDVLNTEYGGMNDVLYEMSAVTGDDRYARTGDRFTKKVFFNPLGLHRDELRGLHVNTHIPQVIGAARRYEISGDGRFREVADFFWYEVTTSRAYVTGGSSNAELWLVSPGRLGEELKRSVDTTECCCAYNLLKLTRHLYGWNPDPHYFDYYERTLYNHRLSAIDNENGSTQYYLSIVPAAWKTFSTENDSFWCCTGTGVEEFSKLNNSIYFYDQKGLYVNLFIPSELEWKEKGLKLRQETKFPEVSSTTLVITAANPVETSIKLRIPAWISSDASVSINGKQLEAIPNPGSYLVVNRTWKSGDRIELHMPMHLYTEGMQDELTTRAFLYGPLVLAGDLGADGVTHEMRVGSMRPDLKHHPMEVPAFTSKNADPHSWIEPIPDKLLTFRTTGQTRNVTLLPFHRIDNQRYSIYWTVTQAS
jgi:DUF1680 family protein